MNESAKPRILVADDDPAMQYMLVRFFNRHGYECDAVNDADQAISMLKQHDYDLLVSDIHMPGNDDLRLAKALPTLAEGLPVILLTGKPSITTAAQSVQLNVVAYLVKPADTDELIRVAKEAVTRRRLHRTVQGSRVRLQEWTKDIGRVEELLQSQKGGTSGPVEAYLGVTLQNMLSLLLDWQEVIRSTPSTGGLNDGIKQHTLVEGLHDAIKVLEKTKQSFKSKDLAELRKRLEHLVRDEKTGAPPKAP